MQLVFVFVQPNMSPYVFKGYKRDLFIFNFELLAEMFYLCFVIKLIKHCFIER